MDRGSGQVHKGVGPDGLTLEADVGDFGQLAELWTSWNENLLGRLGHKVQHVTMVTANQQLESGVSTTSISNQM